MRAYQTYILCAVLLCFSYSARAHIVEVKLAEVLREKLSEQSGDEVYFSVTQYSNQKKPEIFRVPDFPLYWPSQDLHAIQNVTLWRYDLSPQERVRLLISFIEQDIAPLNQDDHLGSVEVIIEHGKKVITQWQIPKLHDYQPVARMPNVKGGFIFSGQGARYKVRFKMTS